MRHAASVSRNREWNLVRLLSLFLTVAAVAESPVKPVSTRSTIPPKMQTSTERQITRGPGGRILTNTGVWSPDGRWIVYDVRPDAAGEKFEGERIERVDVESGRVEVLYQSRNGARCGVATYHPIDDRVVFIHGPEHPTPDWSYGFSHRQGVLVDVRRPGVPIPLDARSLVPPFTPGALRGGSHVHVFHPAGDALSFTYNDALLPATGTETPERHVDLRNVAVALPGRPVHVPKAHPRNQDGTWFCAVVTRTTANPTPGSDEIKKAFEEGWIGTHGYLRPDGSRQQKALAFQGHVVTPKGETIAEVFVVDLPEDLTVAGDEPLEGTALKRPAPPKGTVQRRLTRTEHRRFPGIQGPRHWLRCSPDGSKIGFLMKDDQGVPQLWTISPNGGEPVQVTRAAEGVASTFTWSPDGRSVVLIMDQSVVVVDVADGAMRRLTAKSPPERLLRQEACVFSPDGRRVAVVRRVIDGAVEANQICVVSF